MIKAIFLILAIVSSIAILPAQAQTTSEFGHQLHPEKLLENTEGTLQIFVTSNELMVPKQIENLKAISSDNEIIEILSVQEGNDKFTKNVIIKAKNPGIASIALAAQGFSSKEISLEVFNNNNFPTQLLMKITPELYPIDGPKKGVVAVEIATTGGLPTLATEDIIVKLDTPNKDVIKLENSELVISAGNYYAITEFEIIGSGDAIIFAETENMKKISGLLEVLEAEKPLKLQLYAYPENFNSFTGTKGVAVIQLVDGSGEPVFAEEDIHFKLGVENPDISINTSHDFEEILFSDNQLVIEKGKYSAFTTFSPRPNIGDFTSDFQQTYEIFISAENFLTSSDTITVTHDEIGALEGKGPSKTHVLPFLTTGQDEIIAVTYYETDIQVSRQTGGSSEGSTNRELVTVTVPVIAKENHEINFSSSELDTVNPINPIMKRGESVTIVFGKTGTIAPENPMSFYVTDNEGVKTIAAQAIGPVEEDIQLMVEPLIPMILAENEFPSLVYLEESEGEGGTSSPSSGEDAEINPRIGITSFIEESILTFSANDLVDTNSVSVNPNQPYYIINMISNEVGSTTLSYQMGGFDGQQAITSHTTDPAKIILSFPENVIADSKTLATAQLLDSAGNPVYSKKDVRINLVSNNEQILKIPDEIVIKNGDYFTTLELETFDEGEIELAVLSEDFALSKYTVNVVEISPELSLNLIGGMNWNERLEAKLSVTIPEITTSLDGFNVEWVIDGGEILQYDEVTNSEGIAIMNILANDKETITISATVSGNGLSSSELSKTATILNMPVETAVEEIEEPIPELGLPLDTNTMIFIIIPVAIGAALFMLKRMDKLDMITERIPIGDKIEEIKEKISDIRNR